MEEKVMDTETREQIVFWMGRIEELLPQRKTEAEHLFTAACCFLAWTRGVSNDPRISEGRSRAWGILRALVREGNLTRTLHEAAVGMVGQEERPVVRG